MEIVCTIGPKANNMNDIREYIKKGMTIPRFNFSHADYNKFDSFIKEIKKLDSIKYIMQDLQGNKLRVDKKFRDEVKVKRGARVAFCLAKDYESIYLRNNKTLLVPIAYEGSFSDFVNVKHLYMKDATMKFKVLNTIGKCIYTLTLQGGVFRAEKGINAPGLNRNNLSLTQKDKEDLEWGIPRGVNLISLSYAAKGEDVKNLRNYINTIKRSNNIKEKIKIFSKIECMEGIENFEDILKLSDGIILGRGDLKGESKLKDIPKIEEKIIKRMKKSRKNLFIATYLLDSMSRFYSPSIGEINDIYHYTKENVNGFVLSTELTISKRPEKIISTLHDFLINFTDN